MKKLEFEELIKNKNSKEIHHLINEGANDIINLTDSQLIKLVKIHKNLYEQERKKMIENRKLWLL